MAAESRARIADAWSSAPYVGVAATHAPIQYGPPKAGLDRMGAEAAGWMRHAVVACVDRFRLENGTIEVPREHVLVFGSRR